ncbi:hypothetical protein RchiOBHm_Chr2g0155571 [Rosa chinensis]|uniref:Uncharacterized protein n=1 Tax=Rosa chinensis TaxID=74649 RepID=A0A2P6S182_ROSCH|nr:uncharacterized protein LOC112190064 isoform X1 [Rosa chinensis]PRQ52444.1 hypothetical protein RchiOBHm_Chr2g0155571 [Rosa chinensis]
MASKTPDEPCISETEVETIAMRIKRKRSRRVSFADTEITSVHIFNRDDEDSDNAPDSELQSSSLNDSAEPDNGAVGFFKDVGGESDDFKDSDDDEDDDGVDGRKSFLRPLGSPSPMSSVPGSATSNNEEDFFGPVSADFIRPGLSDSAASDSFHETTMDTTAFSLHYRSLARSDFGGDLKTPTSFRLAFEEKTPTPNPSDSGSLMSLTKPKNLTPQSSVPVDKVRGGEDSNDMSIIEENPHRYDYGRLSPKLDALLAEGSKDLHADSITASISKMPSKRSEVTVLEKNGIGHMDLRDGRSTEMGNFGTHEMSTDPASISRIKLSEAIGLVAGDSIDDQIRTPNQLMKVSNELTKDLFQKGMESLELPAANGDLVANVNSKATKALENSPKDRRYNTNIDPHSDKEGSRFMLSARGQQSIMNTPNLARHSGTVTPSSKHKDWYPAIQKSISRLRIPEPSPRASSLKDGIEKLRCRLSSHSSPNAPLSTVMADISKDLQRDFNKSPTAFLEKQVGDLDKGGQKCLVNTGTHDNENPVNIRKLGKDENSTDTAKDEASLNTFADILLKDKLDRPIEEVAPPSQLSVSGSEMTQHLLMSENNTKGTMVSSGTDCLLADEREENLPHVQLQSENNFETPLSGAGILNIQLQSPDKRFQPGLEPQSKPYVSRSMTEPSLQCPPPKDSALSNSMEGPSKSPPRKRQTPSPPLRNTPWSPLREEPSQSPCRKETARSPSRKKLTESLSWKETIQPFIEELIGSPIEKEPNHSLFLKELTLSPFRPSYAEHIDNMGPVGKDMVSSELNSNNHPNDDCYQGLHISQSLLTKQDADNSFGRKRRNLGITLQDGDCTDKIPDSQRSSKIHRSENYDLQFMLGHASTLHSDREKYGGELGGGAIWESWTDILVKFSGDSEQLLSPLTSNLNLKAIGVLEDILIHLLKAKKYETLCAEIKSQKVNCISAGHKRVAEARLLLYRLANEKAKLQLMHLKHQKLQSRVQLLSSAVQESQMLKLNFIQCQSEAGKGETLVDESRSCLVNHVGEQEASCDNVSTMRQELRASDEKIKSLSKFFHSHIKFKGEPSYANTIALVHDHLKTRTFCRLIRQELQSWDVDEFEIKNGHYNIILSYHGYIIQRFSGNMGPTSCIVISKKLNNVKIMKAFPNIDALVAFDFVLDAEATREMFDSRCLAEETQVTRSQLCNLLDVAEEVQLARFEIVNLIQTSFHTPSDDQLDLQLCFLNCKSSRKVTLSLDMTCLKRGVYPSEILPYQIQAFESAARVLLPQSLLTEIRAAAEGLEPGSTRIMRLCKCISQVV